MALRLWCSKKSKFINIIGVRLFSIAGNSKFSGHAEGTSSSSEDYSEDQTGSFEQGNDNGGKESILKDQLLTAALRFVPKHGWSRKAIVAGAESEGMPPTLHGLFPRGGPDLVHAFYVSCNSKLADTLSSEVEAVEKGEAEKKKTNIFIRDALKARISMVIPYAEQWPQAMAIMALPQNAPRAWKDLSRLVDDIWYYAGDRSVDFNWYTKRGSLAAAYKTTEIFLLQDGSEDFQDTWKFLDRRLHDLGSFGSAVRKVQQGSDDFTNGLWGACIVARNMMGMNDRNR